jgi:hypothetical protein
VPNKAAINFGKFDSYHDTCKIQAYVYAYIMILSFWVGENSEKQVQFSKKQQIIREGLPRYFYETLSIWDTLLYCILHIK